MHCLRSLSSLNVSRNRLESFPDPWACPLKQCKASSNAIEELPDTISIFWRSGLQEVDFTDNKLKELPPYIFELENLNELYLTNNPLIRELPAELGQLSNLWQLDVEDLNITNVPPEVRKEGPASILAYLRAHLRKAEPCKLLKMLLVGPPRQGKTALLEALNAGRSAPAFASNTCSISTSTWELDKPGCFKNTKDSVVFNVWDLGGPASMSTVNQCFFTDRALYVARAPNSAVVVVGTHLDLIDTKFRTERIATLRAYILALCRSPSGARATGYPDVTWKQLHEVSCTTLEGMDGLRPLIYQVATSMKDHSSSRGQRLVGRLIPRSYLTLQEAVLAESRRRDEEDEVQYLTAAQLDQVLEQNPESDIRDYEDLQSAIKFLIETGTLMHFPDTSHGLCTLYFLCPAWLSECLERIIHLKSSRSVARNGVICAEDLRMLLVGTGFTQQTEEQYFQFLSKFEIALPMSFVPAGFWERFIARMLISLTEMDLQSFESIGFGPRARSTRASVVYSFAGGHQRNRCSTFRVRRSQTIYWKEGLLVIFSGGYLSVESSDVNWKRKKSGGIQIICQSESRDFSAMAFITDHVNSLIEQWFPAGRSSTLEEEEEEEEEEKGSPLEEEGCTTSAWRSACWPPRRAGTSCVRGTRSSRCPCRSWSPSCS
ncbi:hypothetical protein CRUP_019429 [Coryphaenoides rupestris]|nr:hypothetical protein CRUP_019429 [Coryphaenoides rupestris]